MINKNIVTIALLTALASNSSQAASALAIAPIPQHMAQASAHPGMTYMARLTSNVIICPRDIADVVLFHSKNGFLASRDGCKTVTPIHNYTVDRQLQGLSQDQLGALLQTARIKLSQSSNGEFRLELMPLLRGGLATGAWLGATAGFWLTTAVFEGFYYGVGAIVSTVGTPAVGYAAKTALKIAMKPVQVAVTKSVTLTCGIAGGVASGPV